MADDLEQRREAARRQVRELRSFYEHLAVAAFVIVGLFFIDLLTGDGWWVQWVVLGWGAILAIHAFKTFVSDRRFGQEWEDRKVREITDRQP